MSFVTDCAPCVTLVTGASGGIGLAAAWQLAQRGHPVALCARNRTKLDQAAEKICAAGGTAIAVELDVTRPETIGAAVATINKTLGTIAALINNAAVIKPLGALGAVAPAQFTHCLHTNVQGPWQMAAAVLPQMVAAQNGVIINLSSAAADTALTGRSPYCISKAALAMLTRMIDCEYAAHNIAAYGLRPGVVDTPMQTKNRQLGDFTARQLAQLPMSAPDQPAQAIVWLVEQRPAQWRGAAEPDIRDPKFQRDARLTRPAS